MFACSSFNGPHSEKNKKKTNKKTEFIYVITIRFTCGLCSKLLIFEMSVSSESPEKSQPSEKSNRSFFHQSSPGAVGEE